MLNTESHFLRGRHLCRGQWRIFPEQDSFVRLSRLQPLLKRRQPRLVAHADIAWKSMDNPSGKVDARYARCSIEIPGIIVCEASNPYYRKYRMIDGSHRMARMTLETDIRVSAFFVLSNEEFMPLLENIRD